MSNDQSCLLLVDDDPVNLEILVEHLEEAGYTTVTAEHGEEAWDILQQGTTPFQAILLDRMMPVMDGMAVLAKIKTLESLTMMPVIMQTAAASSEEIRQGIEAGAFYYLTKPYTKEVLLAIVQTAVRDYTRYQSLRHKLAEQSQVFQCLESAQFHFQTVEQAHTLALILAQACPNPGKVSLGLTELLLNAVEHGNLHMTYDDKTRFQENGEWEAEITRRLTLPEFADKMATVRFHRYAEQIEVTITDQGPGFDWKRYLAINPDLAFASHGRGIAIAKALSFDTIEYRGVGNEVVCTLHAAGYMPSEAASQNRESTLVTHDA